MAVVLDVILRAAEPTDQEHRESIARAAVDLAIWIAHVKASEVGLHRVVERLDDRANAISST